MSKSHVVLCLALAAVGAGCASSKPDERTLSDLSGAELYGQLCASCHGPRAKGDGPVAPLIKIPVPDLTRIAQREGGEFPADDVRRTIDGRYDRPAHGSRDMPVWGWRLFYGLNVDEQGERARVDAMIGKLVDYLQSIQEK
jgi:mono/diheme cytochrome c family protein